MSIKSMVARAEADKTIAGLRDEQVRLIGLIAQHSVRLQRITSMLEAAWHEPAPEPLPDHRPPPTQIHERRVVTQK